MSDKNMGYTIPQVLIPAEDIALKKWACVACDQFTSQIDYWQAVEKFVGNAPSTLHIMLPEIYLEEDTDGGVAIKENMQMYLETGILQECNRGVVLTVRNIKGKQRRGILLAIDLDEYDYVVENKPQIRATEDTLLSRIPPRIAIRRGAALEMPHIMLMMDDPTDKVIGDLYSNRSNMQKLYDFELMMNGGSLQGYFTEDENIISAMHTNIANLERKDNMLFCVGDGNHSLATAKAVWEEAKQNLTVEEQANSPLKYALCEVINLHDPAVDFQPIHRVVFNVNPPACAQYIVEKLKEQGKDAKLMFGKFKKTPNKTEEGYQIPFLCKESAGKITIQNPTHPMAVGEIQGILESYVEQNKNAYIDYIHGDEAFEQLSKEYDNIGFYLEPMKKSEFFDMIIKCKVLPKKTFSLGEAEEKRYYMECRKLI